MFLWLKKYNLFAVIIVMVTGIDDMEERLELEF